MGGCCNCTWKCTLFLVFGKVPVPRVVGRGTVCCRPVLGISRIKKSFGGFFLTSADRLNGIYGFVLALLSFYVVGGLRWEGGEEEGGREVFWGLGRNLDCLYYSMQVRYNIVKCRNLPIITCICVLRERYELLVNVNVSR